MSALTARLSRPNTRLGTNLLVVAVVAVLTAVVIGALVGRPAQADRAVPHDTDLEAETGVRFSRIAVVGDGGLLTLSYTVLDPEKATRFQADREHPPLLRSEARDASTHRVSLMKNGGHVIRAGQTYYLVYQNTAEAVRPGESATIEYDGHTLKHFPVL